MTRLESPSSGAYGACKSGGLGALVSGEKAQGDAAEFRRRGLSAGTQPYGSPKPGSLPLCPLPLARVSMPLSQRRLQRQRQGSDREQDAGCGPSLHSPGTRAAVGGGGEVQRVSGEEKGHL